MYQKTWSNSQEVLLSEKSKIWERIHYMIHFVKGTLKSRMCLCLCGSVQGWVKWREIWQDTSTAVTWVI